MVAKDGVCGTAQSEESEAGNERAFGSDFPSQAYRHFVGEEQAGG